MSAGCVRAVISMLAWVALFGAQMAGAHLHLCVDTGQTPLSVHAQADPAHADHHHALARADGAKTPHSGGEHVLADADAGHGDYDVALAEVARAKPVKPVPDLLAFAALFVLAWALPRSVRVRVHRGATARRRDALRWRPPLRGPPAAFLS